MWILYLLLFSFHVCAGATTGYDPNDVISRSTDRIIRVDPGGFVPLPLIKKAPDFQDISRWINKKPLHIEDFRGKVVLVNFWTYSCINCIRTFDTLSHLYETYKDKDFALISIHTPEYNFEKNPENVVQALHRYKLKYPVGLDNYKKTFNAYGIRYWPTNVLIDKNGMIRKIHEGEGAYNAMENAIRELLSLDPIRETDTSIIKFKILTPEIHLGFQRGVHYTSQNKIEPNIIKTYDYTEHLNINSVGLKGQWIARPDSITAVGAKNQIDVNCSASKVYIVLSGISNDPITVEMDGLILPKKYYSQDMNSKGEIVMWEDRAYELVDLRALPQRHLFSIHIPSGISAYELSFTD